MNYPGRLIKKGERNQDLVKGIQNRLNAIGVGLLVVDGDFGEKTAQAIRLFQARNNDIHGNPLIVDGVLGAISWEALFNLGSIPAVPVSTLNHEALNFAISQIGIMEDPMYSNAGTDVERYLDSVNLGPGYAWCMAFVYYCYQQGAFLSSQSNPLVKTGGCLDQWNRTTLPKLSKARATSNPLEIKPGSVFIMDFGGGLGHTGIVESVGDGFITTIEGNTNTERSRNGVGVFRNTRKINSINKGFIII
jgi:peptidoglycan hydrolase-like protein with peptidoglycan-binding domain